MRTAFSVVVMLVMIVTALVAAVLYGVGAAVEQRQAAAAPDDVAGKPRLLVQLARNPLWLLGLATQFGGFATHAVALRSGPLAVVQMLITGELIVAVLLVRAWSGRKLSRTSWAAALTVVAGIATFLALTTAGHGPAGHGPAGHGPAGHGIGPGNGVPHLALAAVVALGIATVALGGMGLGTTGRRRALLLAVAAGLADSGMAVVTMAFAHVASHGIVAAATSWTVYAVAVCGVGNLLMTQTAYQAGRPMLTLPVISSVTPIASAAIGIGLLGEAPALSAAGYAGAGAAVLVTSLALAVLARSVPAHPAPVDAAAADRAPGIRRSGSARGEDFGDVRGGGLARGVREDLIVQGVRRDLAVVGSGDAMVRQVARQAHPFPQDGDRLDSGDCVAVAGC